MALILTLYIPAILAIIFGILILLFPGFLRVAVGLYLIIVGVLQLLGQYVSLSPAG